MALNPPFLELIVPVALGISAYIMKALDRNSSIAGIAMGSIIVLTHDFRWLLAFIIFFVSASIATLYKYKEKKELGLSQKQRKVENVLGNGLMALIFALYGYFTGSPLAVYGFLGAVATATADTFSSELGVLSKNQPVSVLDFKTKVKRGANGGVTNRGNTFMFIGASIIAILGFLFNNWALFWLSLWGGIFGCTVDSVLGATLENKGSIGNSTVNFLATLSGGGLAILLATMI